MQNDYLFELTIAAIYFCISLHLSVTLFCFGIIIFHPQNVSKVFMLMLFSVLLESLTLLRSHSLNFSLGRWNWEIVDFSDRSAGFNMRLSFFHCSLHFELLEASDRIHIFIRIILSKLIKLHRLIFRQLSMVKQTNLQISTLHGSEKL
jgi:hypothetical protein